ncbi:MAG TPA: amidohydrolase family protein [Bryobacteraceae bacterium]|nr:amidohydrolase family protein [Bryobacteraceae bacterium]
MSATRIAFTGQIILPGEILRRGTVECQAGRIIHVAPGRPTRLANVVLDAGDGYISPGFIDIHVHGGNGADYMDGTPDAVRQANRAHLRRGTTSLFPTTTTGTPEEIGQMLAACAAVARRWKPEDGARIPGTHLYGPYFAPGKAGCHPREGCRDPLLNEYDAYLSHGRVRIATCAAELPGALEFYRAARRRRCLVTCGHSEASWPEMAAAYEAGMRHVDHFWCAMSSVASVRNRLGTPMRGSMEQFVLAHDEMSTEVIADGQHLSPELLTFAWKMKGPKRLCLVTDANRAMGMRPGRYRFGHQETGSWFESDGKVGFVPGGGLASSVVGLDTMVRVMRRDTPAPLEDIIRMASLTPAERAGVARSVGSLAAGKLADVLILDAQLRVKRVFVHGINVI